jgi:AcrR family transcriptional regulator
MRADAARNREKLLTAAAEEFAERGAAASLEAIAKRAGVGIGTLYRHFPTREALVSEAYAAEVGDLRAAADELLTAHAPDEALARWLDRFVDYSATKRGMGEAINGDARAAGTDQIAESVRTLVGAAVTAGAIRPDVEVEDVRGMLRVVWQVSDADQARRMFRILMDGLKVKPSSSRP